MRKVVNSATAVSCSVIARVCAMWLNVRSSVAAKVFTAKVFR